MVNLTEEKALSTFEKLYCWPIFLRPQQKLIISAFNIPLSIVAILGNVLIIAALQKVSSLHAPSKLLFSSLASTDLSVGLVTQPLFAYGLLSPKRSKHCYYAAILSNTIALVFCGVSLFTVTAISVDRFLALMLGLRYKQVVTLRRARTLIVTFWLFNIAIAIITHYNHGVAMYIVFILISLCMVASIACYVKIYIKLRHHQAQVQDNVHQGQPNGGGNPLNIARYRKTVSSAIWVQITLVACYAPFTIYLAVFAVTRLRTPFLNLGWAITYAVALSNSTLNPFLYCWKMRDVRQAVKDTIQQFC